MAENILKLKVDSQEYEGKIKRATQGLLAMEAECRKMGGTLAILEKEDKAFVEGLGNMETVSRTARGRISELSNAYVELAVQYRRLTDEEKKGDYGKALNSSLTQLKGRLNDAKKELADVEGEMKGASAAGVDFNSVLASLGQRFGINSELMGVLTSGTLATTAAITAGAAAVAAATKMWADYNDELNRQTNVTTVTTGLKGDDAENLTMGVRALARTYDVDFRDAINAANTLIQQFGVSGEQALSLLQDGMQGMIAGDGGKLLSMIQQYAPSFRDAGISASQLVAVIQNSEGGLFTDENMQAISMGIRNIRLMTAQTSNALAQLGIDGQEMSRKLEDGSMTIFDALRQVSGAIDNVDSGSKAAGEVMQAVFGRQGTMAGTKLGEAIATLNTNLEETKTQTGELGESFVRLNEANVRLENTMKEVFGMTGWEDMNNLIKTDLANTLSDVIEFLGDIKTSITDIGTADGFNALCNVLDSLVIPKLMGVTTMMRNIKAFMDGLNGNSGGGLLGGNGQIGGGVGGLITSGEPKGFTVTTDSNGKVIGATRNGQDVLAEYLATIVKNAPKPTTSTPKVKGGGKSATTWAPIQMQAMPGLTFGRSLADVNADMGKAQKAYETAGDEAGRAMSKALVEKLKDERNTMLGEGDVTKGGFADAYTHDFPKDLDRINANYKEEKGMGFDDIMGDTSKLIGGLQQVAGGLEQMGVEMPDGVKEVLGGIQGLMSVIQGVQAVIEVLSTTSTAAQIVALNANTATLVANMGVMGSLESALYANTVTSAIPFFKDGGIVPHAANGWVVPGTDFSDRTPILASSGEVVLNRAQVGNVASQLAQANSGGGNVQPYVNGEDIWLGVNNFLKRSGRGEIITSR